MSKCEISMHAYPLTWIMEQLAVGHAPMSYEELDSIREQGVGAIVNLCGEYRDLHQIERDRGFEVYYLPVDDNQAPPLRELEKALQWLDEAMYLGKKVLIHCTYGVGRTGTFVTSYLLRRGFSLKLARQKLKRTRAESTSFSQWLFLRRFGKKEGVLTIREPSLEGSRLVNLVPYFEEYEALAGEVEALFGSPGREPHEFPRCGRDTDACCKHFFHLELIEAAYLSHHLNRELTSEKRLDAIQRGVEADRLVCRLSPGNASGGGEETETCLPRIAHAPGYRCPLNLEDKCIAFDFRPITCRIYGTPPTDSLDHFAKCLHGISQKLFFELNGAFLKGSLVFPMTHVVSGKFVQEYFHFMTHLP